VKITLNLATRPYSDHGPAVKRLRIGMAALVVVLIGLGFGWLHFHKAALQVKAQEEVLDRSISQIRQEEQGYQRQMQQPDNARVLTQAGFLNSLFDEKSFSWTAAMEDLERVLPAGVQVTAIEPVRAKDGRLTLRLRISGLRERSVEMVRNMEHSPRFASPRISGENEESSNNRANLQQASEPNRVSFDLLAEYNPATLEERRAEIDALKRKRGGAKPAALAVPISRVPPQYVPPNPQPVQRGRAGPGMRRMPGQNGPPIRGQQPSSGQQNQGPPTGFDPNGLQNHDRNRIPPPDFPQNQQPNQPQEQPQ